MNFNLPQFHTVSGTDVVFSIFHNYGSHFFIAKKKKFHEEKF